MKNKILDTDVLCIGGGIAGLMVAIRASEMGAKVVVADKANTSYSGSAAAGCDHFRCYIPEVHGPSVEPLVKEFQLSQAGGLRDKNFVLTYLNNSFEIVKLWERWGIPMKYKGEYEFAGHAFPGRPFPDLKYAGQEQKKILTNQARKRGVVVMNRVMVIDLLGDSNSIGGAIGINTKENALIGFRAKSVVLGTGQCNRLYPSSTPSKMFNMAMSPNTTGDGRAMAYRVGAELVSMEIPYRHAGPKYFARAGKATWIGVYRDPHGKPVAPFVTKPERKYGDIAGDIYKTMFKDYSNSGKGPVYMDCRGISDEDLEYMMYWMKHEGNVALINHLEEEGIDLKKNPIEFMTYEMAPLGGVNYNEKGETSVKGLYAAGDELLAGFIGVAATMGWIAGKSSAEYAKKGKFIDLGKVKTKIKETENFFDEILARQSGPDWNEFNAALQQIMYDYAGSPRSETLLKEGLAHLRRLRDKAHSIMIARNFHELERCIEVLNLIDLAEIVFITADRRMETRGTHIRADYPFTNPLLDKLLFVKKIDGKLITEWREIKR